ncbi:glycyl-radical enzyme activating protein [Chloroflexota bacterium]
MKSLLELNKRYSCPPAYIVRTMEHREKTGTIFNIQKFSVHDGPGIRTTIFMKGCPLRCRWCSNAESMSPELELGVIRSSCNGCGKCVQACPEEAIRFDNDGVIQFNRALCTTCGECVALCSPGAITIYGKQVTVDDVFKEISRDKSFYVGSSGGITVSGGEPLRQADFVAALFQMCHQAGISTCLDTCGYAATNKLKEVLAFTDYALYDIKHMDTNCHQQFTGAPNDLILNNAQVVATSETQMLCRIPLITGVNNTTHNIAATAQFVKALGNGATVELLPYHHLGIGKYQTLDKPYPGEDFITPSSEEIESVKHIFEEFGVPCTIGG